MEYKVALRAAPVRFTITKKTYAKLTAFRTSRRSNGNISAVSTRLWPLLPCLAFWTFINSPQTSTAKSTSNHIYPTNQAIIFLLPTRSEPPHEYDRQKSPETLPPRP